METIFKVVDASLINHETDESVLKRLKRKEFGRMSGISVQSNIEGYEKSLLKISTKIDYIGIENDRQYVGITGYYLTIFQFENADFFKTEEFNRKATVVDKCFHVAQAHAYAIMSSQAVKYGLAPPLMEPTPDDKIRSWRSKFLNS
jgi:hypothetical protein